MNLTNVPFGITDTIRHLLYNCVKSKAVWHTVESWIRSLGFTNFLKLKCSLKGLFLVKRYKAETNNKFPVFLGTWHPPYAVRLLVIFIHIYFYKKDKGYSGHPQCLLFQNNSAIHIYVPIPYALNVLYTYMPACCNFVSVSLMDFLDNKNISNFKKRTL